MITFNIMKSLRFSVLITILCMGAQAANVLAQDNTEPAKGNAMDKMHKEMMAKWQEYAMPGAGHKALEPLVVNWDYTITWWETPDSQPQKSTGTS
jgi:hypothetical protein